MPLHSSIRFMLIFTLLIAAPFLIFLFYWPLSINVFIVYDLNHSFLVQFSWNEIIEFFVGAFLLPLIYYIYIRKALFSIQRDTNTSKKILLQTWIIECVSVICGIFIGIGEFSHKWNDSLNYIDKSHGIGEGSYNGMDTTNGFIQIYFGDEWIGHWFIMVPYFFMILIAIWVELLKVEKKDSYSLLEKLLMILLTVGLSILNGIAAILSETGIILLMLQILFTIILLFIIKKKQIHIRDHPLLLCMLLSTPLVIAWNIGFILIYGWIPYFPYYGANFLKN